MYLTITPQKRIYGTVKVPGDKSISHRAVIFAALADGVSDIKGFLMGEDCLNTISCLRKMGIRIEVVDSGVTVYGKGIWGLEEPEEILDVGNSGTTIRLMSGILAGQKFTSIITGDSSIRKRPMGRVAKPLRLMGATILGRKQGELAPLAILGGNLKSIKHETEVASAQVKSAILLAGLYADGWTEIKEPYKSRDHSERMLKELGAEIEEDDFSVRIKGKTELKAKNIQVPGDISSAAFLMTAAAVVPEADLTIKDVGLNPTRSGIIDVLQEMGADIYVEKTGVGGGETVGNIQVKSSSLKGIKIGGALIPRLVDEIPVIAVAAACAQGVTEIRDAEELKVKESNRLMTTCSSLSQMGVDIEELPDGLRIHGGKPIKGGAVLDSLGDHRIAMSLAIAGLVAAEKTTITNAQVVNVSFPGFEELLNSLFYK